ncbi:MAG TPA: helix-turn-helix transcriptional regulator [Anaerolineales bacterium]|nr:helix-turn-helix transcriptional regulator [Anaerolineales bacterium]
MSHLPPESTGQRIARLRQQHGYTQQTLADRLAISRVAVSHIEADLSIPSERTITLLAGLFKCTPHALVEGTTYPPAKAERLPYVVAWYTEVEKELELLKNDLAWAKGDKTSLAATVQKWQTRLARWQAEILDEHERTVLAQAWEILRANLR